MARRILYTMRRAFSLIELSIVLVILGLLIGGILSGKSLIAAASLKAQIEQVQSYRVAAFTFRDKYFFFPGDLPNPQANSLSMYQYGRGNSNGDGLINSSGPNDNGTQYNWEHALFWYDLSTAGLIGHTPKAGGDSICLASGINDPPSAILPTAKIGQNNLIYVWTGGWAPGWSTVRNNGYNYLTIAAIRYAGYQCGAGYTDTGLTVGQAWNIDTKIDDGLPQSGKAIAFYTSFIGGGNTSTLYAAGPNYVAGPTGSGASAASATSCMDSGGIVGTQKYTLSNEDQKNCALSFQF